MTTQNKRNSLFDLGQTVATPGAIEALQQCGVSAASLLGRHQSGDWGDLDEEDIESNHEALRDGFRIFSSYQITETTKMWIITEADRSVTTLLLPEDY